MSSGFLWWTLGFLDSFIWLSSMSDVQRHRVVIRKPVGEEKGTRPSGKGRPHWRDSSKLCLVWGTLQCVLSWGTAEAEPHHLRVGHLRELRLILTLSI